MNEEDIKDDLRTLHKILWNEHREGTYTIQRALEYINQLETDKKNLIKRNKKLEEENEDFKLKERNRALGRYGEIEVHDLINKILSDDYISKSKVKEKIEELKKAKDITYVQFLESDKTNEKLHTTGIFLEGGISALQEFLEEGEKC